MSTSTAPGPSGGRDVEGLGHDPGNLVAGADQEVVLGDRHRDAGDVGLLEGIRPDQRATDLPVMATTGMESIWASASGVTRLVAPGPDVAMQTPTLPVACA